MVSSFCKGKKTVGLLIAGIAGFAIFLLYRFPLRNIADHATEKGLGFHLVKESTYTMDGFEYTIPAAWEEIDAATGEGWKRHIYKPTVNSIYGDGYLTVVSCDYEFVDKDFTGDYRVFFRSWYSENTNYKVQSSEFVLNEKLHFTAQKQECTSTTEGKDYNDLSYLVADYENGKLYLIQYRMLDSLSTEDRANFDVIVDNLAK